MGIGEFHAGHRLADGAKGVTHCSVLHLRLAGRYVAGAVAVCKNLENRGGIDGLVGDRVETQAGAVVYHRIHVRSVALDLE
jgi:hypothetical protein